MAFKILSKKESTFVKKKIDFNTHLIYRTFAIVCKTIKILLAALYLLFFRNIYVQIS